METLFRSAPHVRRRRPATSCGEQRSPVSLSVDTLDSKNNVSTANADTSSAVVKPVEEVDESAAVVVGYVMVPLMKSSRAKPGRFEDRSGVQERFARFSAARFRMLRHFSLTLLDAPLVHATLIQISCALPTLSYHVVVPL